MTETSEVTGPLLKAIRNAGIWVARMQSGKVKVRGGWMYLCPNGTADILVRPSGRVVWLETKLGKYGQSADQVEFQKMVEGFGDEYYVVRSVAEGLDAVTGRK